VPHILEHTTLCGSERSVAPSWMDAMDACSSQSPDTPSATPSSRCCRGPSPTS
jgi:hypothetical protein